MTFPKVSIIILNWNELADTIECLEYLQKITYPNYEVIVVDNGLR
jgi:GT2 family glycosyltransferase